MTTNGTAAHVSLGALALYRVMKGDGKGGPVCGTSAGMLGARPRDLTLDKDGQVGPGRGGITVGPDPKRLHPHFRPTKLGGLSKLPLFAIDEAKLEAPLQYAPDGGDRTSSHGVIEASAALSAAAYQSALAATAPSWWEVP